MAASSGVGDMHSSAHNAWYLSRANDAVFYFVIAVVAQLVAALTTFVSVLRHGLERIRSQVAGPLQPAC